MTYRRLLLPLVLTALVAASLPVSHGVAAPRAVRGVVRGDLGPASGMPFVAARRALEAQAAALQVDASRFRFESVRRSIVGVHVRGREFRGGVPVEHTSVAVHMVDGRVWQVEARASSLPGSPAHPALTPAAAVRVAEALAGVAHPFVPSVAERRLVPNGGSLADAYVVWVASVRPAFAGAVVIRSTNGRLLEIRDDRRTYDGRASVFDPNPVVTLRDPSLREPGVDFQGVDTDLDSRALDRALVSLPIKGYEPSQLLLGRLVGPWVDARAALPLQGPEFHYTRSAPQFEATMSYAHMDRLQRFFQGMGFRGQAGVNAESQLIIAFPVQGFDNSFYQPGNDLMLVGAGGVDDGEDAEVIVHEYGHAVHDAQVPGWGEEHEGGSMGEGWGDFLAGAFYAGRISGGFQDECIMDWDATSYSDGPRPAAS
ncbi:MAG: M36 family metallopeptidase [Actinobacteria bacterium]|nr:M36 family metallopeptidase [Actinomycetota bacterium]